MLPWDVLRAVTKLVDGSGVPDQPGRCSLLWHIVRGTFTISLKRHSVAVLPNKLNVGAQTIVLTESPSIREVLLTSLRRRRPAFVLPGTLAPVCQYFGVDEDLALTLRCSSSGLAICFGHCHGRDVVVHASMNGDAKWVRRQVDGAKIGREVLGNLVPEVIDAQPGRLTTAKMPGHPNSPWNLTEPQLQAGIIAALEPLKRIYDVGHCTGHADHELLEDLCSYVRRSPYQALLQPELDLLQQWDRKQIRSVVVHGDYWLNNILFSDEHVTAVLDWDRSRLEGCAGIDALHLGFMSYAMWSNVPVSELLIDIFTERWRFPWLSSYCKLVREMFSLDGNDFKHLAILLWLSYFPFYDDQHREEARAHHSAQQSLNWYLQMISPMSEVLRVMMQHSSAFRRVA